VVRGDARVSEVRTSGEFTEMQVYRDKTSYAFYTPGRGGFESTGDP